MIVALVLGAILLLLWPFAPGQCLLRTTVLLHSAHNHGAPPAMTPAEWARLCGWVARDDEGQPRLQVSTKADQIRITMHSVSRCPGEALQALRRGADNLSRRAPSFLASRTSPSLENIPLRDDEQRSWQQLQEKLQSFVRCAQRVIDQQVAEETAQDSTVPVSTSAEHDTSPSPQPADAQRQLETAQENLALLLDTRTPQHPDVIRLQQHIDELSRQMERATVSSSAPTTRSTGHDDQVNVLAEHSENRRIDLAELSEAEQQLHAALAAYVAVREESGAPAVPYVPAIWLADIVEPAHITSRTGGLKPVQFGLMSMTAALSSGIGFLWMRSKAGVLRSVDHLRVEWNAPVVAVIGNAPATHLSKRKMELLLIRGAELLTVALIGLCLVFSLGDPTFFKNLFHDPWLAIGQAWFHWRLH
jgi:hypothetical protein